jgi:hypothetical protein
VEAPANSGEQTLTIVYTHLRSGVIERVEQADGKCLGHDAGYLVAIEPGDFGGLLSRVRLAGYRSAAEDQRDDAALHVLVDAGQLAGLDVYTGLLEDLASHGIAWVFVKLDDAARLDPCAVVCSLDRKHATLSLGADGLRSLRLTHQAASLNDNACQRSR